MTHSGGLDPGSHVLPSGSNNLQRFGAWNITLMDCEELEEMRPGQLASLLSSKNT